MPLARRRPNTPRPATCLLLGALALVLAASGQSTVVAAAAPSGPPITTDDYDRGPDGAPLSGQRIVALTQVSVRAAQDDRRVPGRLKPRVGNLGSKAGFGGCDYSRAPSTWKLCRRGDAGADRSIVVLGHSHGRAWIPAFQRIAKKSGYAVYYLVKPQCSPVRLVTTDTRGNVRKACAQFNRWTERRIAALDPDLVTISGTAPSNARVKGRSTSEQRQILGAMRGAFARLIRDVSRHADEVAVIRAVPVRRTEPGRCLSGPDARLGACLDRPDAYAERVADRSRRAARARGAAYVDSSRWFCAAGRCPGVVGPFITMRDTQHISTRYARRLAGPLGRDLGLLR